MRCRQHGLLAVCDTSSYHHAVPDVNVRNVPEAVLDRLRAQAEAEGVSLSEWVRSALADRAQLPTAAEMVARRQARAENAQPAKEFAAFYQRRLRRRSA
jgi:hypothetical protein